MSHPSNSNKPNLLNVVKDWIDERTGLIKAGAEFLHEEIPGGTRFSYTLGSACMFLLTIQIVTGIWQLFYYVPTIDYAYASLSYLRLHIPYGWLIHGIHYWGGTLFTIIVGLHCLRVFIWGSYKKPREMVWLIGIFLIILTALFMFTGPVLPWDKTGYWAGQVGIGIAGSVPIVGPFTEQILQGANKMGQMALTRIYVLHVALLPGAIMLFVMLHLVAFRKYGESGPWDPEKRKKIGYFWPEQIFKDVVVSFLIFLLLVYLSAFFPAPFAGLADPQDTLVTPKPAWNFLFLYQILKFLPGNLEFVGTAGVPLVIVLLFGSLPFLDSNPEKNPFKRSIVVLSGFAFVGVILFLTWMGYVYRSPAELAQMEPPYEPSVMSVEQKDNLNEQYQSLVATTSKQQKSGAELFKTLGCTECHTTNGKPTKVGPDLAMGKSVNPDHYRHDWLYQQIIDPQSHNPKVTLMPPFAHLSSAHIEALIAYIQTLQPPAPAKIAPPPAAAPGTSNADAQIQYGEGIVNSVGCIQCHTITGSTSNKVGPDLIQAIKRDKPSKEWLKDQLTNPQSHNPTSIMPSFASRLNADQMNAVIAYLGSLATKKSEAMAESSSSGAEGASGAALSSVASMNIIGDKEHGAILFHQSCIMCHGPHGDNKTPGFKGYQTGDVAPKGVPVLNPIDRNVYSVDPQIFVNHIDQFIQHGAPNVEQGGPAMPDFGDSHALTQAQIADLEAYVLWVNGVDRTLIDNPGIEPHEFFYILLWLTSVIVFLALCYWFLVKLIKI